MEETILKDIQVGQPLEAQSEEFQEWFNEMCFPQINFNLDENRTCKETDEYGRPKTWEVEGLSITANYFTENNNYNFKNFILNGTI